MTFSNSTTQSLFQRRQVVLSAIAVAPILLAGTGFAVGSRLVGAQESATPAPGEGVTKEVLGTEISALAPDRVLLLQRRTFAPWLHKWRSPGRRPGGARRGIWRSDLRSGRWSGDGDARRRKRGNGHVWK